MLNYKQQTMADDVVEDSSEGKLKMYARSSIWIFLKKNNVDPGNDFTDYDDHGFGSVWPSRDNWRWKGGFIPYKIKRGFTWHYQELIMAIIKDINSNLKDCIEFRFVQLYIMTILQYTGYN